VRIQHVLPGERAAALAEVDLDDRAERAVDTDTLGVLAVDRAMDPEISAG
jgi:hypothetical protein